MVNSPMVLLSHKDAQKIDTLSRNNRMKLVKEGKYPQPVLITPRRVGFIQAEVEKFIRERASARLPIKKNNN